MKRKALGRGLSALLPEPTQSPSDFSELPLDRLRPNHRQPRQTLTPDKLAELAASIRANGVLQPILVRPVGDAFEIVAGERRWRAAAEAGLKSIPVSVREVPDDRVLELALVENVQREELTPIEEAQAFRRMQQELGLSQEDIASRVGRDRTTIANTLRLLRLPKPVQEMVDRGVLSAGHARAILALGSGEEQLALAEAAANQGLSVREVERRTSPRPPSIPKKTDANTRAAEERLRAALGTRVAIKRRGRRGVLQITFGSEDELNRIFERLVGNRTGA